MEGWAVQGGLSGRRPSTWSLLCKGLGASTIEMHSGRVNLVREGGIALGDVMVCFNLARLHSPVSQTLV